MLDLEKIKEIGRANAAKASSSPKISSVKSSPVKSAAPAKSKGFNLSFGKTAPKKDMTWGGRPDPTPEIYVEDVPSFFNAPWRYGRSK